VTHRIIQKFRFVFALTLVLSLLGISAPAALADAPVKYPWTISVPGVVDACPFAINIVSTYDINEIDFFDQSGALTRVYQHVTGQDSIEMLFDSSGMLLHYYVQGVVEKIPLPDGSLFITAGRTDGIHHPGETFILSPDKGNQGKIAAFCAALAP
jgi:hypothetical protein